MELSGKTAVIMGGANGIGRALALRLASEGCDVFIGDVDEVGGAKTVKAIEAIGRKSGFAICDIMEDASVADFADAAFVAMGSVNLLFNHAGVSAAGPYESLQSDDWNWVLNANVTGLGRSLRAFLPRMSEGWIINTSSSVGLFHDIPLAGPYIASKAGIIGVSRALATALRNRNIGVSVFCPDITATSFMTSGRLIDVPAEAAMAMLPLNLLQTPEQAADVAIDGLKQGKFLLSATPAFEARLEALSESHLEPGSDCVDVSGRAPVIIQEVRFRIDPAKRDQVIEAFDRIGDQFRAHKGVRCYDLRADLRDPGQFCIFEAFDSQNAQDAHGCAPETLDFFREMLALGAGELVVRPI
jgi:NAD(P)-dependent dehydrogenase (short-subunit alcohol dehydrogenase family)/quinol monooxygenase YgiN